MKYASERWIKVDTLQKFENKPKLRANKIGGRVRATVNPNVKPSGNLSNYATGARHDHFLFGCRFHIGAPKVSQENAL